MLKIKEHIKELRIKNNLTQKKMAVILDVAEATLQKFEYGTARPSLDTLLIIANHFDVSLDYLVGRTNNPDSHKN